MLPSSEPTDLGLGGSGGCRGRQVSFLKKGAEESPEVEQRGTGVGSLSGAQGALLSLLGTSQGAWTWGLQGSLGL